MAANTDAVADGRKTKIAEYRQQIADIDAELVTLHTRDASGPEDQEAIDIRWDELCATRDAIMNGDGKTPGLVALEERQAKIEEIQSRVVREFSGMPEIKKPSEEFFGRDVTRMTWQEAREGALRALDDSDNYAIRDLSTHQLDILDRQVRQQHKTDLARRMVVTESPAYRSAFMKITTAPDGGNILDDEERHALRMHDEYQRAERAQSESNASGGYAIPVLIDPSVILTDQELDNPFLRIANIVDIQTNAWKGVSSAGVVWSFDSEAAEVSDDSLTSLAQPTVSVFTARGFIPFSIEISQDWPGFQSEMARLLSFGWDDLLLSKLTNGNGTSEPKGVTTALTAQTSTETVTLTDGAFGQEDIYAVWKKLGQKYRKRASWMMSVGVMNKIRQFGAANVYHATTVTLQEGAVETLFGRPVYENAYMPDFTGTTGAANIAVVGDFGMGYTIARRQGLNVELVPHLLATANNLPSGSRGWFAYARLGGNVVNNSAFQILVNT